MTRYKKQYEEMMKKTNIYIEMMIKIRDDIIKNVFKNKGDSVVNVPVAFSYIIGNIQGIERLAQLRSTAFSPKRDQCAQYCCTGGCG